MGKLDICAQCQKPANRVGTHYLDATCRKMMDVYVCDACNLFWPTEWAK